MELLFESAVALPSFLSLQCKLRAFELNTHARWCRTAPSLRGLVALVSIYPFEVLAYPQVPKLSPLQGMCATACALTGFEGGTRARILRLYQGTCNHLHELYQMPNLPSASRP